MPKIRLIAPGQRAHLFPLFNVCNQSSSCFNLSGSIFFLFTLVFDSISARARHANFAAVGPPAIIRLPLRRIFNSNPQESSNGSWFQLFEFFSRWSAWGWSSCQDTSCTASRGPMSREQGWALTAQIPMDCIAIELSFFHLLHIEIRNERNTWNL